MTPLVTTTIPARAPRSLGPAFLYSITRVSTNQKYIGISLKPDNRWWTHRWLARQSSSSLIHKAIAKHGEESFNFEIIACSATWSDGAIVERELIAQHRSYVKDGGYNLTRGGEGQLGRIVSPETRAKNSASMKGRPGRIIPPEEREVHRQHVIARYKNDPLSFVEGARRSIESRKRNGTMGNGRKNSLATIERMKEAATKRWSKYSEEERSLLVRGSQTDTDVTARAKRAAQTRIAAGTFIRGVTVLSAEERSAVIKKGWETRRNRQNM